MLSSLRNMLKVPDLRNKILFTLTIIAIYRFGAHIPVPGIEFSAVQQLTAAASRGPRALRSRPRISSRALTPCLAVRPRGS